MSTILFGWPYVGVALAVLLLVWLAIEKRSASAPPRWQDPAWVLPLLWPMYLLHQFEEHGVDLLGRHYPFLAGLCAVLERAMGPGCPADAGFIFAVNAVGCQMAFAMSWIFRRRNPLIAACAWGIPLVNGVVHLAPAVSKGTYNPGMLSSLILFAPLCIWMLRTLLRTGAIERRHVLRIVATGVVVHAVLLVSLLAHKRGFLPYGALLFVNVANGLWPLAFGAIGVKRRAT